MRLAASGDTKIDNIGVSGQIGPGMKTKMRSISLPGELDAFIQTRVRSGLYGSASDVIRAGLRALAREEKGAGYRQFLDIMSQLPGGPPLTPKLEQAIVTAVTQARAADPPKEAG
jgi:putative addiction module CopG family antidote